MSMNKGPSNGKGSDWGMDAVARGVGGISLDGDSDDVAWKQVSRKNRNRASGAGGSAPKQQSTNGSSKAWERSKMAREMGLSGNDGSSKVPAGARRHQTHGGRGTVSAVARPPATAMTAPQSRTPSVGLQPPLENGWNWAARAGSLKTQAMKDEGRGPAPADIESCKNDKDDDDVISDDDDDDDDAMLSDDSDEIPESHEAQKSHRMLKAFFEVLDKLTVEEINEPGRQWHCPACRGGPGAIEWYRGLQPLMTHANAKGSVRLKLHRKFAELLEEELRRRGNSVIPSGESFGRWEGLKQEAKDYEIVWPPMIIIMNTRLDKDENEKWIGMGNQELLDYFGSYAAKKARHAYGPQGHRGMSVLIFESSAVGYMEAERLHKHFLEQGTGRDAWDNPSKRLYYNTGKRQLYGFLAVKEDVDIFNQHCQGKSRLKFEMRSYNEMVVSQMQQMSEDNQQLNWYKKKVVKVQRETRAIEESLNILSEKCRRATEENRIVRQRTNMLYEQNKEAMEFQEEFYKDQIRQIHEGTDAKEDDFQKLQQEKRKKLELCSSNASTDHRRRAEEVAKLIKIQEKEMDEFVGEREKLIGVQQEKMNEMKKRHWEEEVELEKRFDVALTKLMEKYKPGRGGERGSMSP